MQSLEHDPSQGARLVRLARQPLYERQATDALDFGDAPVEFEWLGVVSRPASDTDRDHWFSLHGLNLKGESVVSTGDLAWSDIARITAELEGEHPWTWCDCDEPMQADGSFEVALLEALVPKRPIDEPLPLFEAPATILFGPPGEPIGWSLRRVLQWRGRVKIQHDQVVVEAGWHIGAGPVYIALMLFSAYMIWRGDASPWFLLGLLAISKLFAQRPMRKIIPFAECRTVKFGKVSGFFMNWESILFERDESSLHLVTARPLLPWFKESLEERIGSGDV